MFSIVALSALVTLSNAHFFIQIPGSIGFDDVKMTEAPCGGFDPTSRENKVDWAVNGQALAVLSTHQDVTWEYRAALVSNPADWRTIYSTIHQTGVGEFCLPVVPGLSAWAGQEATIQVIQNAPDGQLHQCAAVRFVAGGPAAVPGGCSNGTGIAAEFVGGGQSSSEPSSPASEPASQETSSVASGSVPSSSAASEHNHDHDHPSTSAAASHSHTHQTTTDTAAAPSKTSGSPTGTSATSGLAEFTGAASVLGREALFGSILLGLIQAMF